PLFQPRSVCDANVSLLADAVAVPPHQYGSASKTPAAHPRAHCDRFVDYRKRVLEKAFPDSQTSVSHLFTRCEASSASAIFRKFFSTLPGLAHTPTCPTSPFKTVSGASSSRLRRCGRRFRGTFPDSSAWTSSSAVSGSRYRTLPEVHAIRMKSGARFLGALITDKSRPSRSSTFCTFFTPISGKSPFSNWFRVVRDNHARSASSACVRPHAERAVRIALPISWRRINPSL